MRHGYRRAFFDQEHEDNPLARIGTYMAQCIAEESNTFTRLS